MSAVFPQILIETIVRKAIRDIRDSPKRNTRNLVDMALNFSEGRFQSRFFETAQSMLQDENSAYLFPEKNMKRMKKSISVCWDRGKGWESIHGCCMLPEARKKYLSLPENIRNVLLSYPIVPYADLFRAESLRRHKNNATKSATD